MLRVDENRILSKILEPKIADVRGNWWRLLSNIQSSPSTVCVIKSQRMDRPDTWNVWRRGCV
jgi:hypothetical protein